MPNHGVPAQSIQCGCRAPALDQRGRVANDSKQEHPGRAGRLVRSSFLGSVPQMPDLLRELRVHGHDHLRAGMAHQLGHWAATGTVCWIDPDLEAFCILFTTQPQEPEGRILARMCNAVCAALV